MSIKIGDLVIVKSEEIEVIQSLPYPFMEVSEPFTIKIKKGIIFEVLNVYEMTNSARIVPVNHSITEDFIIIVELKNLYKCGRAVEALYGHKKKT